MISPASRLHLACISPRSPPHLQVAFLEMERIFITLESELLASSTLVDQVRVRVRVRVRVSVRVSCPPPPPSSTRWGDIGEMQGR